MEAASAISADAREAILLGRLEIGDDSGVTASRAAPTQMASTQGLPVHLRHWSATS